MFADFVLDAVGEILNQIAKMQYMSSGRLKMPVLLRGCIGIGHAAATHGVGAIWPGHESEYLGRRLQVHPLHHLAPGLDALHGEQHGYAPGARQAAV